MSHHHFDHTGELRAAKIGEVPASIAKPIAAAQALCASADAAGLPMRGCPVKLTLDR